MQTSNHLQTYYVLNVISDEEAHAFGMKDRASRVCHDTLASVLEELPPLAKLIGELMLSEYLTNKQLAEKVRKVYDVTNPKIAREARRVSTILSNAIRFRVPWDYNKLPTTREDEDNVNDKMFIE